MTVAESGTVPRPFERPHLSVVIPVYRAEECIDVLYARLVQALDPLERPFELVLVDDRSPDRSWDRIRELAQRDGRVKGIRFSRNFGQHYGISAGVDLAAGDWVVVMDCDLQDRPEEIPRLYNKAQEGFDVVVARRVLRQHGFLKRTTSAVFYAGFRYLTDLPYDGSVGNFRIMSRQVANSFREFKEQLRFFGGIITWLGYRVGSLDTQHDPRFAGETTYTWRKLIELGTRTVVAYSDKPLRLSIRIGFTMALLALAGGMVVFVRALVYGVPVSGWASLMVSMYFLFGMTLGFMGVLGLYLGRVFDEVRRRPLYVVSERTYGS